MSICDKSPQAVIWTAFVRITHWLIATFVLINFFYESGFWHRFMGYFCLVLVLARISYGLWLSKVASSQFYMPTIAGIKHHIHEIRTQIFAPHPGHNPLGQLAVYLIWALIAALAVTGWLSRTDAYWGEDWPVDLHLICSNFLQGLVILHIAAVVLMSKLQKRNIVKQMISGKSSDTTG
ncbi:MAG: cytochrome b/b6 domain-containing protein [Methylotenera sp.]|uniref:cytochrome b/b6 domain-containing protein n=1 Tax=Methylotenera sp. TaxID=2051956 RepID=UPI002488B411|nr:cytochrome b/b6 domain-containing protein [Methylotenera sp.]MDI1308664.1 cytochrome b/b6 domain-containing protein [Methylotenera sp.]